MTKKTHLEMYSKMPAEVERTASRFHNLLEDMENDGDTEGYQNAVKGLKKYWDEFIAWWSGNGMRSMTWDSMKSGDIIYLVWYALQEHPESKTWVNLVVNRRNGTHYK